MENKKKHSAKAAQNARENKIKARNQKIVQHRIAILIAVIILVIAAIVAVVKFSGWFDKIPDQSTLTISDDGKVICEELTDFAEDYSRSELKTYMKEEIKEYNDTNGKDSVKLDKIKFYSDLAHAKTTYASAEDYSKFTGYGLYTGTIKSAVKQGFDFSDAFVSVTDGEKGTSVDTLDITSQKKLKVAIIKENINVTVDGIILYVSDACTTMVDKSTVSIEQPDGNEDATQLTYIIYK